jgi:hypothetical protein
MSRLKNLRCSEKEQEVKIFLLEFVEGSITFMLGGLPEGNDGILYP